MITDFIHARDYAKKKNVWVVIVVPSDQMDPALDTMAAISNGNPFGGRTLSLPTGKLTLMQASESAKFLKRFCVAFAGWGKAKTDQAKEMERWRQAAWTVVSRAA
jgi:hypothetical protein